MEIKKRINVIMQGGCMICPLCHSQKKWKIKRDFAYYPHQCGIAVEDEINGIENIFVSADNKVRFIICCDTCKVAMETDSMELINKENYEKYKDEK